MATTRRGSMPPFVFFCAFVAWSGLLEAQMPETAEQPAAASSPATARARRRLPPSLARPAFEIPLAARLAPAREAARDDLDRLRKHNAAGELPLQTGFARQLANEIRVRMAAGATNDHGVTETTPDGALLWTMRLEVPESAGHRVHLRDVALPDGALIWIATANRIEGPFEASAMLHEGEIWAPAARAERGLLAIEIPAESIESTPSAQRDWHFTIDRIIEMTPIAVVAQSGSSGPVETDTSHCLLNGECVSTSTYPSLSNAREAAAQLDYVANSRSYVCSGGLINDRYGTLTPYFLTANHCISTQASASSLVAYWDYRYDGCSFPGNIFSDWSSSTAGSTLLSTSTLSDFTFLRLSSRPGGTVLLGWTAGYPANGTAIHAITHPGGSPQHYTQVSVDTTPSFGTCGSQSQFIYGNVTMGVTQGGSSGGVYTNASGQILGQLYGACGDASDDCATGNYNELIGALSYTYPFIRSWIDTNDECADAITISGTSYSYTMVINGATSGLVNNTCGSEFHSSWWKYTAPSTIRISVDTIGSGFDGLLAIYSGSCNALSQIDCSDDEPGVPGYAAKVWANVVAGQTYYIMASSFDFSPTGSLTLNLNTCPAKPTLTAVGASASSIRATWNAVAGATGYRLYDESFGTLLYDGTATTYLHTGLPARTYRTYYVIAFNGCGDSPRSEVYGAATCPNNVCADKVGTLVATANGTTQIGLGWSVTSGAATYQIERRIGTGAWTPLASNITTTFYTNSGLTANLAYFYRVRGVDSFGSAGPYSDPDLATTVVFTDDPLVVRTTIVRTYHITQLRAAVNIVRSAATLGPYNFTDATLTPGTSLIRAVHITDLRTALNAARSALGLPAVFYTQSIVPNASRVFAADINDLRNGVK